MSGLSAILTQLLAREHLTSVQSIPDILWSRLSKELTKDTHTLPIRARYGCLLCVQNQKNLYLSHSSAVLNILLHSATILRWEFQNLLSNGVSHQYQWHWYYKILHKLIYQYFNYIYNILWLSFTIFWNKFQDFSKCALNIGETQPRHLPETIWWEDLTCSGGRNENQMLKYIPDEKLRWFEFNI